MKQCRKCKKTKPFEEFFKRKTGSKDGYKTWCKECDREYQASRIEQRRESCRKYYEKNKQKIKEKNDNWKMANRERHNELQRNWRLKNPDLVLKNYHIQARKRKIATLKGCEGALLQKIKEIVNSGLVVDHIIPISGKDICGLNVPANLQGLTKAENLRKSNWFDHDTYQKWRKSGEQSPLTRPPKNVVKKLVP